MKYSENMKDMTPIQFQLDPHNHVERHVDSKKILPMHRFFFPEKEMSSLLFRNQLFIIRNDNFLFIKMIM